MSKIKVPNILANGEEEKDAAGKTVYRPATCIDEVCTHTDEERSFVTVVDQSELEYALSQGYRVERVYNALIWPEFVEEENFEQRPIWTTDLFKGELKKNF